MLQGEMIKIIKTETNTSKIYWSIDLGKFNLLYNARIIVQQLLFIVQQLLVETFIFLYFDDIGRNSCNYLFVVIIHLLGATLRTHFLISWNIFSRL